MLCFCPALRRAPALELTSAPPKLQSPELAGFYEDAKKLLSLPTFTFEKWIDLILAILEAVPQEEREKALAAVARDREAAT